MPPVDYTPLIDEVRGHVRSGTALLKPHRLVACIGSRMALSLFAAFDGTLVASEKSFREVGFEYTLQHSISFFFAAALYASRFELAYRDGGQDDKERLSRTVRRICYYSPPPVLGACWLATLLISGDSSPYEDGTSLLHFIVGVVAASVPWLVCGAGI